MDLRHDLALRVNGTKRGVDEPVPRALWVRREGYAFVMADPARSAPDEVDFDKTIEEALDSLPPDLREFMSNVAIVVEEEPPPGVPLLGLYQGFPLTTRGRAYAGVPPDKITIYRRPLERLCRADPARLRREIRRVVLHEVAHHFGISDERLVEIGRY
jgi:predicted Zn-dependent protease with MMP-like domain